MNLVLYLEHYPFIFWNVFCVEYHHFSIPFCRIYLLCKNNSSQVGLDTTILLINCIKRIGVGIYFTTAFVSFGFWYYALKDTSKRTVDGVERF